MRCQILSPGTAFTVLFSQRAQYLLIKEYLNPESMWPIFRSFGQLFHLLVWSRYILHGSRIHHMIQAILLDEGVLGALGP